MKKVLLLGDSIRENYQDNVAQMLAGRAEVVHPAPNGGFAEYTLTMLGFWLRELGTPDIIHWNNGAWDTCVRHGEDGPFTPVDAYVKTLGRILRELRKTGAQVIFATTIPCRDGKTDQSVERTMWYNHNAVELMKREGVPVDDLWSVVWPVRDACICDDLCHLNDEGKKLCAQAVVKSIEAYL